MGSTSGSQEGKKIISIQGGKGLETQKMQLLPWGAEGERRPETD